jgi:hypothetical protein
MPPERDPVAVHSTVFSDHHDQLVAQAEQIIATVQADCAQVLNDLPAQRMMLSRLVNTHCSAEIAVINARTSSLDGCKTRAALVRRFHDELLAWRGDLMDCNAHWSQSRVAQDPQGFLAVFRGLADRLRARVQWEEQTFYPAIMGAPAR